MNTSTIGSWPLILLLTLSAHVHAEELEFKSELFKNGKLVYSDDFEGELNRERWGSPRGKKIEDGKLIIGPQFTNREEAMQKGMPALYV